MLKSVTGLSLAALAVVYSSSSIAKPSPSDESAMNAMKYEADVLGVKLGTSAIEAKQLIQSAITNAKFYEYVDRATNQAAGWIATSEDCLSPHTISCNEKIEVRTSGDKVWFINRNKSYDRKKNSDVPTTQVTQKSLEEKYGILVKFGDYSRGLYASHSFAKDSGGQTYYASCGGQTASQVPVTFSPDMSWYYSILAMPDFLDKTFLRSLSVTLVDCQYMFEALNNNALSDAAAKEAARNRDAAKGIKPTL